MRSLPIIERSNLVSAHRDGRIAVAHALDRACAESGFLYISGKQLDWALFRHLYSRAKVYFALNEAAKMESYISRSQNHSGDVPVSEERFGEGVGDLKDAYDVNCDYLPA